MAPPTIAVERIPDAFVVYFPNPSTESEKMMANITELNKPTPIIDHTATLPLEITDIEIKRIAATAQKVNTIDGFTV